MKKIELLAPAGNLFIGKEAINHGADAVYIGAPFYGARKSAGNSIADIEELVKYANIYHAAVYVTLNTILYNNEIDDFQKLTANLYHAGVSAFIIQDLGILEIDMPPVRLFASTQVNNYDMDRIKFLGDSGFDRIILARELSIEQIKRIRAHTQVDLECFIHGALCVSMSGQCYLSYDIGDRSANRGECGQPCRLPWQVTAKDGKIFPDVKFPLSLKDINLSNHLYDLIHAGISSLKIEGRLKNMAYVKNITAYYRQKIDAILSKDHSLKKASSGDVRLLFKPDPEITFNRGYTDYFIRGRNKNIESFDTPKSIGKHIGKVIAVTSNGFQLDAAFRLNNGDGLCFFDEKKNLCGIRINSSVNDFYKPSLKQKSDFHKLKKHMTVYRNHDHEFSKLMKTMTAERLISVSLILRQKSCGFVLLAADEEGNKVETFIEAVKTIAENPAQALDTVKKQLRKTGGTCYEITNVRIETDEVYFIKKSDLNMLRRDVIHKLTVLKQSPTKKQPTPFIKKTPSFYKSQVDYRENISNKHSEIFYEKCGVVAIEPTFELLEDVDNAVLMTTKHCLLYSLGICRKETTTKRNSEPYYLSIKNIRYILEFDCEECVMKVIVRRNLLEAQC